MSPATSSQGKVLRVLTVGNSLANDPATYLPDLARAAGEEILLFKANLGGHSLRQHADYLAAHQANPGDPAGRPYPDEQGRMVSLTEALRRERWEAVTIQQVSTLSDQADTYEPFATRLLEEIRREAPEAKIYVQETPAFREDHFSDGRAGQEVMYAKLRAANEAQAQAHGLAIIPTGTAFQRARSSDEWTFRYPDPNFDYGNPPAGVVPEQKGSLNCGWDWRAGEEGALKLTLDAKHANVAGRYLGGCVWLEALFGCSVLDNGFAPAELTAEEAASLRRIAHEAVAARRN
jgi:hypothetical protein